MKKLLVVLLSIFMIFGLCSCGNKEEEVVDNTVVCYTSAADNILEILEPSFEEATGLDVEFISLASAEAYAKVVAEREDPQCDVFYAGGTAEIHQDTSLFVSYFNDNYESIAPEFRDETGYCQITGGNTSVLLVNTELCPVEVKGYADLLAPELKGHIAMGDALASNSAYYQIENMLVAMSSDPSKGEPDQQGWDYVKDFLNNLDGKIIDSSSAVYKGVVSGEYWVACTYDTGALNALTLAGEAGSNVEIVLMEEGVVTKTGGCGIVNNCKHLDNAKKLVDYLTSYEWQKKSSEIPGCITLRTDIESPYYNDIGLRADTKVIACDSMWTSQHKPEIVAQYQKLLEDINFGA